MDDVKVLQTIQVEGHDFDIYGTTEDPLFLAADVAKMIDYSVGNTSHMLNTVDPSEKLLVTVLRSGQRREMWFFTEYGFYEVLMQSRKPVARRFKSAVKDILKDMRLNGRTDLATLLNYTDPLVDEFEAENRRRADHNKPELEFAEFLIECMGYTEDMIY